MYLLDLSSEARHLSASARARRGTSLAALGALALLSGCATFGFGHTRSAPPAATRSDDSAAATGDLSAENPTATEAATQISAAPPEAPAPTAAAIKPDAPTQYTVKHGDTLWGIANMFLKDPWLWPEIWYVNPQVENPHRIYPGDVLALAFGADGRPQISVVQGGAARLNPRLRTSEAYGPIAAIPYSAIASFLARPSVLSKEQMSSAPHVLALRDEHKIGGADDEVYVRGLHASKDARFSVVHVERKLKDPESGAVLGYQGVYTATALVTKAGDPAKAVLTDSARETLEGDRLVSIDNNVPLDFVPRAPRRNIDGQIISVVDGVELIGQYMVVVINRGTRDGVESGNVLAINQAGHTVRDRHASALAGMRFGTSLAPKVRLPDERAGTLLVFKTYDRMSYGLVMVASRSISIADHVANP